MPEQPEEEKEYSPSCGGGCLVAFLIIAAFVIYFLVTYGLPKPSPYW